jgi:hypothetical protein
LEGGGFFFVRGRSFPESGGSLRYVDIFGRTPWARVHSRLCRHAQDRICWVRGWGRRLGGRRLGGRRLGERPVVVAPGQHRTKRYDDQRGEQY